MDRHRHFVFPVVQRVDAGRLAAFIHVLNPDRSSLVVHFHFLRGIENLFGSPDIHAIASCMPVCPLVFLDWKNLFDRRSGGDASARNSRALPSSLPGAGRCSSSTAAPRGKAVNPLPLPLVPVATDTSCDTVPSCSAAPDGFPVRRFPPGAKPGSDRRPGWWRGGGRWRWWSVP